MQPGPMNDAVKPIKWLLGTWKSICAKGIFPTISDFTFIDMLKFESWGQPMLHYKAVSWNPKTLAPMHLESGHLRIKPGTQTLALLVAHNFGVVTLEEGCVNKFEINLQTTNIGRVAFLTGPKVKKLVRKYVLRPEEECSLHYTLDMETDRTPLTNHLQVIYKKQQTYGK